LGQLVARIEPDSVPLSQAAAYWKASEQLVRWGQAAVTLLARRVDESKAWERAGCASPSEWRAREGGTSMGDAQKQGKASEQLRDLPDTSDALRKGELSADQAELISDAATHNPGAEQELLDSASKKGLKDLKDDCARSRQRGDRDPDATQRRVRRERRFNIFGRADGSTGMFGNGPVDEAAVLKAALDPIVDRFYKERRGTPDQGERQQYLWDALMELARGHIDGPAPEPRSESTAATSTTKKSKRLRYEAILRVDVEALMRGYTEGDELCEIAGVGPVPVTRMRDLLPDSSIRLVITKGIDVANYTYLGRGPNAAQDIALLWSQGLCQNIACSRTRVERDHRDPYANVKCTELGNIDDKCDHCHDLTTYKGWALVDGTGRRPLVPPTDPRHPTNTRAGPAPPDDQLF
jgi:hypothetical protein